MKGFQTIFLNDLFMFWIRFPCMIFLWVQIVVMFFFNGLGTTGKITYVFVYGFGYDLFMALDMFL